MESIASKNVETNYSYAGQPVDLFVSIRLEDARFHVYDPSFKAKAIYDSMNDAKCLTPEALVESIESATTQEWVDYNHLPGKSHSVSVKAFKYRKKLDKDSNYFELIHKLTFSYNGIPTAIIKYRFVDDGKQTVLASMVVQKKNGRWFRTSIAGIDHLKEVVKRVKSNKLAHLLDPDSFEDEGQIKELKKRFKTERGVLDSEKLYGEMNKLRSEKKWDEYFMLNDKSE